MTGSRSSGGAIPSRRCFELEQRFAGRRIVITGGGGSIGRHLAALLDGLRPERVTLLDSYEASLVADHRARDARTLSRMDHVLCDVRDGARLRAELERAAPDAIFHLAAYKHVDWAERYPEEFVATNLDGSWNVLRAAEQAGVRTVIVASTDKAALATSLYGRTKRTMEAFTALSAERSGGERVAVRLVNVLGSAGSASDLFLRQARAGGPLYGDRSTGMERFWITMAHAATLLAHGALLGGGAVRLVSAADPITMTVGELAARIWRQTGHADDPAITLVGVRPGEVMREVITGPHERLGEELLQGCAAIEGPSPLEETRALVADLEQARDVEERRALLLSALRRPEAFPTPAGCATGMRILLVSQFYPGPHDPDLGAFVAQMAGALERRGHELEYVVIDRRGGSRIRHARLGTDAVRAARRFRPDVVYAHFLVPAGAMAALASLAARVPLVLTAHGQDVRNLGTIRGVRAVTAAAVRRASAVIVVSDHLRAELERHVPRAAGLTHVIDCGVDLRRFAPADQERARQALGWEGDGPRFLFVGALNENKNVRRLVEAFRRAGRGTLVLVGDGPLRADIEGRPDVRLIGRIAHERVADWMHACDVLCQPSRSEAFGQALLEAMACERSVVATRVGGPPEFVTPETGVLVDPEDVGSITSGMVAAAALPSPNPAARRVAAAHDLELQAERVEAVLLDALR